MGATRWTNWSGLVECRPTETAAPANTDEVCALVRRYAAEKRKIRVAGSGHSFSDLVKTDETLVSLDRMTGIHDVDVDARRASARAGTKLWRLNELLDERGLAMENLGDVNRQSIAGAVSTGTHGTGIEFGNLSTQVEGITFVNGLGEIVECSDDREVEVFKAAQVSLGGLGIITSLRLRLMQSYRLKYVRKRADFEETASMADRYSKENRQFEFYFFPYSETVQLKFLNITEDPPTDRHMTKWFNDVILENVSFGAMSRLCRAFPSMCPSVSRIAARFITVGEEVDAGHRVLSTTRLVRFNEMEYAVPADVGIDAIRELKEWIVKANIAVHFPIEFRYVKGDDILISPCYGRDTVAISVHVYRGMEFKRYFDGAEAIFRNHRGRPHWGKLHGLTANELTELYPEWEKFQVIRKEMDPDGVFLNEHLTKLFEG